MSLLLKIIDHINYIILKEILLSGVWKGGNLICAQKYLNYLKVEKSNWIDTFKHDRRN